MALQLPDAAEAAAIVSTSDFIARFPLEMIPFCPEGMKLLHNLAKTNPALYDWSRDYTFVNMDHRDFAATPLGAHYSICAHCNASC